VFRLAAAFACLSLSVQTALPLVLACCSAPQSHECCARVRNDAPSHARLGPAACCSWDATGAKTRKDEALNAMPSRAFPMTPALMVPPKAPVVTLVHMISLSESLPGVARALRAPVPLRI